jgi:hypothetical protein
MEIRDAVKKMLKEIGLAEKWQCYKPEYGAQVGPVVLQSETHYLEATFPIAQRDLDVPGYEEILKQKIRDALAKARTRHQ